MMRDNLCDNVNPGDIIFFGDEHFQVFKANKKSKIERLAVLRSGHEVHGVSEFTFRSATKGFADPTPGSKFKYVTSGFTGTFHGFVTMATRSVKTVPVLFSGGELPVDKYRYKTLICFLEGNEDAYKMLSDYDPYDFEVEMSFAIVVHAQCGLRKSADTTGFNKRDFIAYVVSVNGEGKLTRDSIMKKVAQLEGKPWVPTSNTDYFLGVSADIDAKATLRKAGKGKYGRILYGLGVEGRNRAAKVLARLGPDVGRI
jgi:hypothetical protein